MENIFNNDINVIGGVSATTLSSPTLDAFTTKKYVDDTVTLAIQLVSMGGKYTGRADVEGLRKIGWTNEDIWYYQLYGVNWNREDDELHKVPQNNIDLYGVINTSNLWEYRDILVYLPKIDTSKSAYFGSMFSDCSSLISIPLLDTSNGTDFNNMFAYCSSLISIPLLDTSKSTYFGDMFYGCASLTTIPLLDTSKGTIFNNMFYNCNSLTSIPQLDTSNGTDFQGMFSHCDSLISIPLLDTSKGTNFSGMFDNCYILSEVNLQGLPLSINLSYINQVTIKKESLLYIINNSIATSKIAIGLDVNNYSIYSADADVKTALAAKPFVTLTI